MAYTSNPFLPRVRMAAVLLVRKGMGVRRVAERFGVSPGTISKWAAKAPEDGRCGIPTLSSRPHGHPRRISEELEQIILAERRKHDRCGQVVYETLKSRGIAVSLMTVHRTLDRYGMTKKWSHLKKRHISLPRPSPAYAGALVEIDTIHAVPAWGARFYVYTLIDVASRWAYAVAAKKLSSGVSLLAVRRAETRSTFPFEVVQSDHGPEFSAWFTSHLGTSHRHTRVGKPNDNAHIERFNRSIQDECLKKLPMRIEDYAKALPKYLRYYNSERLHMGLECRTPDQKVAELFPRS